MTLFEIDQKILETFDQETGEILNEDLLKELQMNREQKITNIVHFIKNLEADCDAFKKVEDDFKKRRESAEHKVESLKKFLEGYLAGDTFESDDKTAKVTYRKSETVEVPDVWKLPEQFKKYEDPKADKTAIKKALKAGEIVEGAQLIEKLNIQIK